MQDIELRVEWCRDLAKLPDRTPVKLTISMMPDLHQRLLEYSAAYAEAYLVNEPLAELIPPMLEAFLASDRAFSRRPR